MRSNDPISVSAETSEGFKVSRRQVAKAAAWSLPVIALAVGAPAASASNQPGDPSSIATRTTATVAFSAVSQPATIAAVIAYVPDGVPIPGQSVVFTTASPNITLPASPNNVVVTGVDGVAQIEIQVAANTPRGTYFVTATWSPPQAGNTNSVTFIAVTVS